jgi:hypothetical protein
MLASPFEDEERVMTHNFLLDTYEDARNLVGRCLHSEVFHRYLLTQAYVVAPALLVILLSSVACALATVVFFAGTRALVALLGLVFAPFVLLGSLSVQLYFFVSWLEERALRRAYGGHARPARIPPLPWALAATFVAAPLLMLAIVAWPVALSLVIAAGAALALCARFDRPRA